jgi:ABC-type multidrug transport system fused ATPase/permease subunit
VGFVYENRQEHSLQSINLEFKAGKKVALIGQSGAGKSTLLQLLMRFLLPTEGQIFFNRQDIQSWPLEIWRKNLAWVPQKPMLFNTSLRENIRLQDTSVNDEQVWQAVRQAQLEALVRKFPHGLDTPLGEWGVD